MVRLTAVGRLPWTEGEFVPEQESWTALGGQSEPSARIYLPLLADGMP